MPVGEESSHFGALRKAHAVNFAVCVILEELADDVALVCVRVQPVAFAGPRWTSIWVDIIDDVEVSTLVFFWRVQPVAPNDLTLWFRGIHDAGVCWFGWQESGMRRGRCKPMLTEY